MKLICMNSAKNKSLKISTVEDFGYPNFTKEDMQKLRYKEDSPKNKHVLTKFEWTVRCFMHRVKRRIEMFLSRFSGCDEE